MTEKSLRFFLEAAETENISLAAKKLYIAQPALSKHIRQLEAELGYPLFDRQGKHIILNANGKLFMKYANRIITDFENARTALAEANAKENEQLTLGMCVCSQLLSDIIGRFYRTCPSANITIRTGYPLDCEKDGLDLLLNAEQALTTRPAPSDDAGTAFLTPLFSEEIMVAFSQEHPFAKMTQISASDLFRYPCVLPSKDSCMGMQLSGFREQRSLPPLAAASEVNNSYVQCELAAQGLGYTLVPRKSWRPAYERNHLLIRSIADTPLWRHVCLFYHPHHYRTKLATAFVKYLQAYFSAL